MLFIKHVSISHAISWLRIGKFTLATNIIFKTFEVNEFFIVSWTIIINTDAI